MPAPINSNAETTPSLEIVVSDACSVPPKREMSMMTWMATEGGRKCPTCGKYAKAEELGPTGGYFNNGQIVCHISSYGHLPGFGCNRSQNISAQTPRREQTSDPIESHE